MMRGCLDFQGGIVELPGRFRIGYSYEPTGSAPALWNPAATQSPFALTLLYGASGAGKTKLMEALWEYLTAEREEQHSSMFTHSDKPQPRRFAGYVSQGALIVNHWKASEIVPQESPFFRVLLEQDTDMGKHMGEFSGGQQKRIYICSMLEYLIQSAKACPALSNQEACYALLDETLDGLGADGASQCVLAIKQAWESKNSIPPLYMLVVTHLSEAELALQSIEAKRIKLSISQTTNPETLPVRVEVL